MAQYPIVHLLLILSPPLLTGLSRSSAREAGQEIESKARWMNLIKIAQQVRERAERRTLPF